MIGSERAAGIDALYTPAGNGGFVMRHQAPLIGVFAAACGLLVNAGVAQAAAETWVSATGSDAGTCPRTAPCRTFAFAHSQTNNNGAINVLNSSNFGPLIISKPISIVADGVEAVINTAHGACSCGIHINAPETAIVSLRGLTIDMCGTDNSGIAFSTGAALHVSDSVIRKAFNGFFIIPGSGTPELHVADLIIADSESTGMLINPQGSAGINVVLERVQVEKAVNTGIWFRGDVSSGAVTGAVRGGVVSGVANNGILISEAGGGTNQVTIDRSVLANNVTGLRVTGAGATGRIGNSTLSGNSASGFSTASGGVIDSYGTNKMGGNGSDGTPTNTIDTK